MRPTTTDEWLDRFEKKQIKAEQSYQETGEPRYDRQAEEYDVICSGLRAKLQQERDDGREHLKRMHNMMGALDKLIKDSYTREEVEWLLRDALWW